MKKQNLWKTSIAAFLTAALLCIQPSVAASGLDESPDRFFDKIRDGDCQSVVGGALLYDAAAQYGSAIYSETLDYAQVMRRHRVAAERGNASAQNHIGVTYQNGDGVERDYAQAMRWFRLAAEQGHERAKNSIGAMYAGGKGVERDYAQAVRWFRLAAEQGNPNAQYNLGTMYEHGRGINQDYFEAISRYRLAIQYGGDEGDRALDALCRLRSALRR